MKDAHTKKFSMDKIRIFNRIHISFLILLVLTQMTGAVAEEGLVTTIETSVLVDTVVNFDKVNRVLTLVSNNGEESTFTLGPEVQNIDQIIHGDQLLVQYLNAFAIALGPKNIEPKEHRDQPVFAAAKTAEKNTRTVTAVGIVEAIDKTKSLLTLNVEQQPIEVNVSENYDLASIILGDKVEVTYIESYVINVKPASKILGTVAMSNTSVAIGVGFIWGEGELTMYNGSTYTFDIEGLSILDVGISLLKVEGEAYRVIEPEDIEGNYWAAEMGVSYGNGVSVITMKNSKDVILHLNSKQKGMKATLAAEGLRITNVKPAL